MSKILLRLYSVEGQPTNVLYQIIEIGKGFRIGDVDYYQFGCRILKIVGPKKQDFWLKINTLQGDHCIL